jgi:1-phosphofructokinase family hexose kinase
VRTDFVRIAEESRLCINIVDDETHSDTQIDEVGPLVAPLEIQALRERFRQNLRHAEVAVIAGSAPRGVPLDLLGEAIGMAHEFGVPVFLDARDRYLAEALPRLPEVVKPNIDELSGWAGEQLTAPQGVIRACQRLIEAGINQVVVSLGEQGAISLSVSGEVWWAKPPQVPYVSAVGSGDSMLAGLIHAHTGGQPPSEQLRWAVAAGTANVSQLGAAFCGLSDIAPLIPQVMLKNLSKMGEG